MMIIGYGISIGQNLAWGYGAWESAIDAWHSEEQNFTYNNNITEFKHVGHYTQVLYIYLINFH